MRPHYRGLENNATLPLVTYVVTVSLLVNEPFQHTQREIDKVILVKDETVSDGI